MTILINLPSYGGDDGILTVVEDVLPFDIRRVYFIYKVGRLRGGHRHKKTIQALICLEGKCTINIQNLSEEKTITLDKPDECLILDPSDWHTMDNFSRGSILLVLASELYDEDDYIYERY